MQKDSSKRKLEISFGGCGFLGVYHAGVGQCVCDHAPHLFNEFSGFYGASAGAITAVYAACRCDPMEGFKWVKKTFEASRKHYLGMLHPTFDLYARLRTFLENFLPKNAHRLCRNRVKISLTTLSDSGLPVNWIVSDFNTRTELINAVMASSFIPGYAGVKDLPKFRGKRCFDGGFSSNIPYYSDPNVITVSPFSGTCDICPQEESGYPCMIQINDQPIQITLNNIHKLMKSLCPTSWEELEQLYQRGYEDAKRYFTSEGFFSSPVAEPSNTTEQVSPIEEAPSEYFSVCSHSRSQSMVISLSADYMSCISEDSDRESELDLEVASIKRQPSYLQFEVEETEEETEPSMLNVILRPPVSAARLSMKSLSWVMQSVSPSHVYNALSPKDEHTWEHHISEHHSGLVGSVLSRLTSSLLTF